jgi:hypothetical protein
MVFATKIQQAFFQLLKKATNCFQGSTFWQEEAFAAAVCVSPLVLLVARVFLFFADITPANYFFLAFYPTVLFFTYGFFCNNRYDLSRSFFASAPVRLVLEAGSFAENFLLRRKWCAWFLPIFLSLLAILEGGGVFPSLLGITLRSLLSFYLRLRTVVLYEASKPCSDYIKEIPIFSKTVKIYNCADLDQNKELVFLLTATLLYFVVCVGLGEKPITEEKVYSHPGIVFGLGATKILNLLNTAKKAILGVNMYY